jgi:murein DD-endopeptidase MepM/ murein hydrolase activator NlpD
MVRLRADVFVFYAHIQPGTVAVKVGDRVTTGQLLGKLGNTGNSTFPHLHFAVLDRANPLTGNSLPFVIDRFTVTGTITGGGFDGLEIAPASREVQSAYPPRRQCR